MILSVSSTCYPPGHFVPPGGTRQPSVLFPPFYHGPSRADLLVGTCLACPRRCTHGVPALAGCASGQAQPAWLRSHFRLKPGLRAGMAARR